MSSSRHEHLQRIAQTADHNTTKWLYASIMTLDKTSDIKEIFMRVGKLTPRQLMRIFPIDKTYDGDKYNMKDYFYSVAAMEKHGLDKPIGATDREIFNALWDYLNHNITTLVIEFTEGLNKQYHALYGRDIVTDFLQNKRVTPLEKIKAHCKAVAYNAYGKLVDRRIKQLEQDRQGEMRASLTKLCAAGDMGVYEPYIARRIFDLFDDIPDLDEHVAIDCEHGGLTLDEQGLMQTRDVLEGYFSGEFLDAVAKQMSDINELDNLKHKSKVLMAQATSKWLREIRDMRKISKKTKALYSTEQLKHISEQAADELKRRAVHSRFKRAVMRLYGKAKKGLFIRRLTRRLRTADE